MPSRPTARMTSATMTSIRVKPLWRRGWRDFMCTSVNFGKANGIDADCLGRPAADLNRKRVVIAIPLPAGFERDRVAGNGYIRERRNFAQHHSLIVDHNTAGTPVCAAGIAVIGAETDRFDISIGSGRGFAAGKLQGAEQLIERRAFPARLRAA